MQPILMKRTSVDENCTLYWYDDILQLLRADDAVL